jgi:hypothetical protein
MIQQEVFMSGQRMRWGIFAVLFAGLLGLTACNFQQSASRPDDKVITTEIQAQLFQDSVLKTRDIRVVSQSGAVVMTGAVATELEKAAALRIAQKAPGVQQVIDQLTVDQSAMASASTATAPAPAPEPVAQPSEPAPAARPAARERASAPRPAPRANRQVTPAPAPAPAESAAAASDATATPITQTAQAVTPPPTPPPAPAPPVPQPEFFTIPSGTIIRVQTIDRIDSSRNQPGDEFAAIVESPVAVGDRVVIPRNSDARLRLVEARSAGRMTGRSELQLELIGITVGEVSYPAQSSVHQQQGSSRGKRTAETVGGGAALGALIGAIAGRGKGAAIGAAVGAGSGAAVQAVTHGEQVKVPPETKLDFTLRAPLTIRK